MREQKYIKVVDALTKSISSGRYSSDVPFPSERALETRFQVSRQTIQRALRELNRRGLIVSRKGSGTFLTHQAVRSSRRIGVIIPGLAIEEIFPPICQELSHLAYREGYSVLLGDISAQAPRTRASEAERVARHFVEQGVAGVIFQPMEFVHDAVRVNRNILSILAEAKIPVVLLDYDMVPPPERSGYDLVGINNFDAGRRLALHLLAAGARRIGFLMRPNWGYSVRDRMTGVKFVAEEVRRMAGTFMLEADPEDTGRVAAWLKGRGAPDAIVCGNDTAAAMLLKSLRELGYRVPEDVRVAGFDDVKSAQLVFPPLTTVHQPCTEIAHALFTTILERMAHPDGATPRSILLDAQVVVRASTSLVSNSHNNKAGR